jgi:hypothetical protein
MLNPHSKPLKQSTIDIYKASTKHGHFSGFSLSHLHQDNSIRNNYAGASINTGSGTIISGNAYYHHRHNYYYFYYYNHHDWYLDLLFLLL